MNKRITPILIALLAIASMARGATDYGLTIAGVNITSANYNNIGHNGVSFDPTTATLTLSSVNLSTEGQEDQYGDPLPAIEFSSTYFQKFRVKLIGTNYLWGSNAAFRLKDNALVYIDGPGSLEIEAKGYKTEFSEYEAISLNLFPNSELRVRGVNHLKLNKKLWANSGSKLTIINSSVTFSENISGLGSLSLMGAIFEQTGAVFRNGKIVYSGTGNEVSSPKVLASPGPDLNKDGAVNLYDFSLWKSFKVSNTGEDISSYDINSDGILSTADLVMIGNVMGGTVKTGYRVFLGLHEIYKDKYALLGLPYSFVYDSSNMTETWVLTDLYEEDLTDTNASNYSCSSSDPTVATVSMTDVTVWGNLKTKGFKVTAKKSGFTNITISYDDKQGNVTKLTVPMSLYKQSDLLQSADKIYGVKLNETAIENVPLNLSMNVPVGTTMRLSIDKDPTYGYDLETRKSRIACTSWEVTDNNKVTLKKTGDGYVELYVGGEGSFTVTAKDGNNNQRMASFVARDVYSYDSKTVYKNGETFFSVPESKISSVFGKANWVAIEKMVTHAGSVWTIVNHYERTSLSSELGQSPEYPNPARITYTIPIYAQVFRNNELVYEKENTYFNDFVVYNYEDVVAVGYQYNPDLEFGGWGSRESYGHISDYTSMRFSAFYTKFNAASGTVTENLMTEWEYESMLTNITIEKATGAFILQGYSKRRRSTEGWTETSYCYPRDWFLGYVSDDGQVTYSRDKNQHWTYMPYALAVAKNRIVGAMGVRYYKSDIVGSIGAYPHFDFSGCSLSDIKDPKKDILKYHYSDTGEGSSIELEGTESRDAYGIHFGGFTSSSDSGSLYGWMDKKIYKFSDDFTSYDTYRTYNDIRSICDLKVLLNSIGSTAQEEFIVLGEKNNYKEGCVIISALGESSIPDYSLKGFDLMNY